LQEQSDSLFHIPQWELGVKILSSQARELEDKERDFPSDACLLLDKLERNKFPYETKPFLVVLLCSQWLYLLKESRHFSSLS
jgi:hypothetical protein